MANGNGAVMLDRSSLAKVVHASQFTRESGFFRQTVMAEFPRLDRRTAAEIAGHIRPFGRPEAVRELAEMVPKKEGIRR